MTFFNLSMLVLMYKILAVSVDTIDSKGMEALPPFNTFRLFGVAIYGFIHSLKEFVSCLVSVLSGTTVYERQNDLELAYFKDMNGPNNHFDKVKLPNPGYPGAHH